jgi:HlyD family secretion protein
MKKKILVGVLIVLIAGSAFGYYIFNKSAGAVDQYAFGETSYGDIENTISSTGTLSPVTTVEIGTQVSGIIAKVHVDYNDMVKKGQLLAVLDTVLLKASVLDAEAGVTKAEAQLEQAQVEYERNRRLFDNKLISDSEFLPYSVTLKTQQASLVSSQAALQRAMQNLENAYIYSPINGTVIEKSVEEGQTVAASLSTPTLFIIAEDLSRMEILANVDESDIGSIKEGQAVRFDVQAYPDKQFDGRVTQIRLQPQTVSNVVTYTVVVTATNQDGLLLPGMTATVDFIIEQRNGVLTVPSIALRFQPSEKVMADFFKNHRPPSRADRDSTGTPGSGSGMVDATDRSASSGNKGQMKLPANTGRVWYLDSNNNIAMAMVKTGITDGTTTEITSSRELQTGMKIITGLASSTNQSTTKSSSGNRGMMRPPRF